MMFIAMSITSFAAEGDPVNEYNFTFALAPASNISSYRLMEDSDSYFIAEHTQNGKICKHTMWTCDEQGAEEFNGTLKGAGPYYAYFEVSTPWYCTCKVDEGEVLVNGEKATVVSHNSDTAILSVPVTLEHKFDSGKITKNPTSKANGVKTFTCKVCGETKTAAVKYNPLTVKPKTKTVKYSTVRKKNVAVARKYVLTVSKNKGTVTYAKAKGNSRIVINKKTGNVTVKKGIKKGTYKVTVKVKAAGDKNYAPLTKKVTFKIVVK